MLRALALLIGLWPALLPAAESAPVQTPSLTARLIAAEAGVGAGEATLNAGLDIVLEEGWKTYWRSPGEVGLPPQLDWSASANVADVALSYPAPERFDAFDIQNYGYGEEVVFPLTVTLEEPGAPARLDVTANLLVCSDICVPETVALSLDLPTGGGVDAAAAARLSDWVARVPGGAETGIEIEAAHLDGTALTLRARSDTSFSTPDVFPEQGEYASFDAAETVLSPDGRTLWARLPLLSEGEGPLQVTLTDGPGRAATLTPEMSATPPAPPGGGAGLWPMLLVAMLGGLILNVMPCVLPVLSIKLAGAVAIRDAGAGRVRAGFLASSAGILAFFAALALLVIGLRAGGVAVGWGMQFQQPIFLAVLIGVMTLFAANLFGAFEFGLGSEAQTGMTRAAQRGGLGGDFATGAFAALMATPCSAPFLGTAITYALTHGPAQILAVFLAMGVGLAVPYLAVAVWPAAIRLLPRPGPWMVTLRRALGGLLLLAVIWLVTVLAGAAGWPLAGAVAAAATVMLVVLMIGQRGWIGAGGVVVLALMAALLPQAAPERAQDGRWDVFDMAVLDDHVATGAVVFVDVTADWCLTCQANKRLVLQREGVSEALASTVAMQADWTRPDPIIADYLKANDRFGIPFNAVYGPGAPKGIVLPEILTEAAVLDAIARAGG
ncbi:MAG: protein-disulfide reductase DsbD domain-containing protein [Pseudomonadota bacterium]